jgi:hypothetical protein
MIGLLSFALSRGRPPAAPRRDVTFSARGRVYMMDERDWLAERFQEHRPRGRVALNMLRARKTRREEPLDAHLPAPIVDHADGVDPGP